MTKTHWKKLDNPNYIGAYSLMGVTDSIQVTIDKVVVEKVKNAQGQEDCKVAYFKEKKVDGVNVKPMILNSTNCKAIEQTYDTPFIDDWAGCQVQLYTKKIKAFGESVDALRIRAPKQKKSIDGKRFAGALQAIESGQYTKEKLLSEFNLTNEQNAELENI